MFTIQLSLTQSPFEMKIFLGWFYCMTTTFMYMIKTLERLNNQRYAMPKGKVFEETKMGTRKTQYGCQSMVWW